VGHELSARFVVLATGCLSAANLPDIPGRDSFAGPTYHTGRWPHEGVDLAGVRVGVIGTGSSGIQSIPVIAEQAEHLTVFQRTPAYSVPAHNGPLDPAEQAEVKARYAELRAANRSCRRPSGPGSPAARSVALEVDPEVRRKVYEERWDRGGLTFLGASPTSSSATRPTRRRRSSSGARSARSSGSRRGRPAQPSAGHRLQAPLRRHRLLRDLQPAERELVDLSETPIEAITPTGIRTTAGEHELDAIVFATGFDAMTGALDRIDITGRDGAALRDVWAAGPRTYLGLGVAGSPTCS
jgi:cation diffusion facilitator CzcD-associated flavoprotein CzcO